MLNYQRVTTHRAIWQVPSLSSTWPCLGFNRRLLSFRCLHEGPAKIPGDCQSNRWITTDSVSLLWNKKNAQGHPFRYEPALLFKKKVKFVFVVAGKNLSILVQIQQRHVAAATKRAALLLQGSQIKERHHSKTKCIFQKE